MALLIGFSWQIERLGNSLASKLETSYSSGLFSEHLIFHHGYEVHREQSINTQSKKIKIKIKTGRRKKLAVTSLMTRIELSKLSNPL